MCIVFSIVKKPSGVRITPPELTMIRNNVLISIGKYFLCLVACLTLLSSLLTGNGQALPDIIFVQAPAQADSRYIDGCQILSLSTANLSTAKKEAAVLVLTGEFLSARDPDISFDGKHIMFAGKQKQGDNWQIWQMDIDGRNKKQITTAQTDCISPLYIGSLFHLDDKAPTRRIAYMGTFDGKKALISCNMDGAHAYRISFNEYAEFAPYVMPNGRILYSSAKSNGNIEILAVNIDGTDLMGYLTRPYIPGNKTMVRAGQGSRVYFIKSHAKEPLSGGKLSYVNQRRPFRSYSPLGTSVNGFFHSPCPLPDGRLLVSYRNQKIDSLYGLYMVDPQSGKLNRKVYSSKSYHCIDAKVLAPRPAVKGRSSFVDLNRKTGVLYCVDVYISQDPRIKKLARGSIKYVRVIEGSGKHLGSAPVEADGSFHIEVPAQTALRFELLDKTGNSLASQHTWSWVMPRESRGCIGCHEDRELSPPNRLSQAIVKPAVKVLGTK